MAQYYFTVAALPMLAFDDEPYFSTEDVVELCASELSGVDLGFVSEAAGYFAHTDPHAIYSGVLGQFHLWERGVRDASARLRAQRLGWEAEDRGLDTDPEAERIARDMINQESPLDAEMVLQRARWQELEWLEVGHYFDIGRIVIYLLKLSVIERNRQIDTDRGAERFNEIYSHMVQALTERAE